MKRQGESKAWWREGSYALFVILVALMLGHTIYKVIAIFSGAQQHADSGKSLAALLRRVGSSSRIADFTEHVNYISLDHQFDRLWEDELLTPNGGFLTANKKTHNTDKLGISMFHQLHCLGMIRGEIQHLHQVIGTSKAAGSEDIQVHQRRHRHNGEVDLDAGRPEHRDQEHAMHCFDYLRQAILCLGDSTIERPRQFPDGKPYINGMGQRKCKNWALLYEASTDSDDQPMSDDERRL